MHSGGYFLERANIAQMIEEYHAGDFRHCVRVLWKLSHAISGEAIEKAYCTKCVDIYTQNDRVIITRFDSYLYRISKYAPHSASFNIKQNGRLNSNTDRNQL